MSDREVRFVVEGDAVTVTEARNPPAERIAGAHVHLEHTDAFYVLEGELTFEVGPLAEAVTVSAGGFVAVPPGVAHAFRTSGDGPARWLTIHAPDGGFAAFIRGRLAGVDVEWDIAPVPPDGGLPAAAAVVS